MNSSLVIGSQLLATKFYVPVAPGALIARPRLSALLAESLKHPLTLVSCSRWLRQNDAALGLGPIFASLSSVGRLDFPG